MANSRHYLNNQQVEEPRNWEGLTVTVDWSSQKTDGTINFSKLEFAGQTAVQIIARMEGGLTGSVGYFEGEPYRIEIGELNSPAFSFNGYLDFTDNPLIKDCNIVEVALKQTQGKDWLDDVADSFSFRYLADNSYNGAGKITSSDYYAVPYIINYIPDGMQLLILAISTFSLAKELVTSIQSLAQQTTDLINGVIPVTGTGAGFGVTVNTDWDLGDIIGAVLKLAITLAYTIGIIYAIIKLVEQIIEQLTPKQRWHLGMSLKTMFVRCCEYLGLTYKSTLIDSLDSVNKWVLIPSKGHKGGSPPTGTDASGWIEVGYPTSVDGIDTFGDLIRISKEIFNADFRLKNGTFEFERKDFWKNTSGYKIPNTFTNQTDLRNETSVNTTDIKSNYVIKWATDQQDLNTLDNQTGRLCQVVTSPIVVNNPELVNVKGKKDILIPFSMAVRKDALTAIEEAVKVFLELADFLTGQLGQPQGFAALMTNRIGSMHLSSHFLSIPKMVVMNGGTLALNQRTLLSARGLWDEYHYIESFVTIANENAQRVIYSEQKIPFCFEDFVTLAENNIVQTVDGEDAEIEVLEWEVESNVATVTYKVSRVYDNNLKLEILE